MDCVDTAVLHKNISNASDDTFVSVDLDREASVEGEDKECATVGKNNDKTAKINRTVAHQLAVLDVVYVGWG